MSWSACAHLGAVGRRGPPCLLERAAAAARDAGALQVLDTMLWIMSLAELNGGTPRAAGERIEQVRELRRAIGYDAEHVVNAAYSRGPGRPRAGRGDRGCGAGDGVRRRALRRAWPRSPSATWPRATTATPTSGSSRSIDEPFLQVTPLELRRLRRGRGAQPGTPTRPSRTCERLDGLAAANGSPWAAGVAERGRALVEGRRRRRTTGRRSTALEPTGHRDRPGPRPPALRRVAAPAKRRRDAREQLRRALEPLRAQRGRRPSRSGPAPS